MSKYDSLKYWVEVRARVPHRCQRCGTVIGKGEYYYKEKLDLSALHRVLFLGNCAWSADIDSFGLGRYVVNVFL